MGRSWEDNHNPTKNGKISQASCQGTRLPIETRQPSATVSVDNAPRMTKREMALTRSTYTRNAANHFKEAYGVDGEQRSQKVGHAGEILNDS